LGRVISGIRLQLCIEKARGTSDGTARPFRQLPAAKRLPILTDCPKVAME